MTTPPAAGDSPRDLCATLAKGGAVLAAYWQPVWRSADLPSGVARPLRILGRTLTLYRTADGEAVLTQGACSHRGAPLWVGTVEGDAIRCRYHRWKFGADGACREQPGEPVPFLAKVSARTYPVREYLGLVFAYLGSGEPPAFPEFDLLAPGDDGELVVHHRVCGYNFFWELEHSLDPTHNFLLHPQGFVARRPWTWEFVWTRYGAHCSLRGDALSEWHYVFPNAAFLGIRGFPMMTWKVPVDDQTHASVVVLRVPKGFAHAPTQASFEERDAWARAIVAGTMRLEDVASSPYLEPVQDLAMFYGQQVTQGEVAEHLGVADRGIIELRKRWKQQLSALASSGTRLFDPSRAKDIPRFATTVGRPTGDAARARG